MKKNKGGCNSDISELIFNDYVNTLEYADTPSIVNKIPLLIDNGLAYVISGHYYPYSKNATDYRVICMMMQRYNKKLKDFRRAVEKYEFGGSEDTVEPHTDKRLLDIVKYAMQVGTYYSQFDASQYGILVSENFNDDGDYGVQYKFYIVGDKWKKWRDKIMKEMENYRSLTNESSYRNDFIETSTGDRVATIFKSFDQVVMKDKDKILAYIDNWVKNIPVYYEKYNMVAKLSIMIHGDPGTGKSTFAKALAKYLNIRTIEQLGPDRFYLSQGGSSDDPPRRRNTRFSMDKIYLIDDIDCVCHSRKEDKSKENNEALSALLSFLDNPPSFKHNCDGVLYPVSVVVATTNYYDNLDSAVSRFGRFDLTIEMKEFDRDEAQEMCDIYGLQLDDIVDGAKKKDFTISPAKLQAICLEKVDESLKKVD